MPNSPLPENHTAALKDMLLTYGLYRVLCEVERQTLTAVERCRENTEAVIHRDVRDLVECVRRMKGNHFIRLINTPEQHLPENQAEISKGKRHLENVRAITERVKNRNRKTPTKEP